MKEEISFRCGRILMKPVPEKTICRTYETHRTC